MENEPTSDSGDRTTVLDRSTVSGREATIEAALGVARAAQRELAIFSMTLGGELFTNPEFLETVRAAGDCLAACEVRILVAQPCRGQQQRPPATGDGAGSSAAIWRFAP